MTIWCICPFDRPKFLPHVLQSFRTQTCEDKHLVLVCNGDAVDITAVDIPQVTTLFYRGRGRIAGAMNVGLAWVREQARAKDLQVKWDSDDVHTEMYLVEAHHILDHHPEAVAFGKTKAWVCTEDGALWSMTLGGEDPNEFCPHGGTLGSRVRDACDYPLIDCLWGEDDAWWAAMRAQGAVFASTGISNYCWMRYAEEEHRHSFPLSASSLRMLPGRVIQDFGRYDIEVIRGRVAPTGGRVLPPLPMDPQQLRRELDRRLAGT